MVAIILRISPVPPLPTLTPVCWSLPSLPCRGCWPVGSLQQGLERAGVPRPCSSFLYTPPLPILPPFLLITLIFFFLYPRTSSGNPKHVSKALDLIPPHTSVQCTLLALQRVESGLKHEAQSPRWPLLASNAIGTTEQPASYLYPISPCRASWAPLGIDHISTVPTLEGSL